MSDSLGDLFVKPRLALRDVRPEYFGGLVLFGGSGATLYWNDSLLLQRVREFAAAGKLVAAIGTMPLALANAGVLKGRRATVFRERPAIAMLRAAGARHSFNNIVSDRGVITAADWRSARAFGRAVAAALRNR
jgi:protease I